MRNVPEMTPRERLLAALRGDETDRIPWSPFLAYWWEAQSEALRNRGDVAFLQEIGADPLLRGASQLYQVSCPGSETTETVRGRKRHADIHTPVGTLTLEHTYVPNGNTWFLTEHPIKTIDDLKIFQWMNEHTRISPDMDEYVEKRRLLGEGGLIIPIIGTYMKSSFQTLVEHWIGTVELTYMLEDHPEPVEECLAVMQAKSAETVRISVQSEAEAFIFWEDSSTTNITPSWFSRYTAPELNQWAGIIHDAGKLLIHHACGHLRDLLPLMAETGIDSIESISPPPTGNIGIWDARAILPEKIGLIGGIEPTVFLYSTYDELEEYVTALMTNMTQAGRSKWILANSDSCPPGVSVEKFKAVTHLVREFR
jgi:uroporphyrinogen-III decarboxylase